MESEHKEFRKITDEEILTMTRAVMEINESTIDDEGLLVVISFFLETGFILMYNSNVIAEESYFTEDEFRKLDSIAKDINSFKVFIVDRLMEHKNELIGKLDATFKVCGDIL